MTPETVARAERALRDIREALSAEDMDRANAAFGSLMHLTERVDVPSLARLRGEGQLLSGRVGLLADDDAHALANLHAACDLCVAMGEGEDAMQLAVALSCLRSDLSDIRGEAAAGEADRGAGRLFEGLLGHVLDRVGTDPAGGRDFASLSRRVADAMPGIAQPVRLLLASFTLAIGEEATDAQRSADALAAYLLTARLLDGVTVDLPRARSLAHFAFMRIAFERMRHGDAGALHLSLDGYDRYLRKQGVDVAERERTVDTLRAYYDIHLAVSRADFDEARRRACDLVQVATPDFLEACDELLRLAREGVEAAKDMLVGKPVVGPGRNMAQLAEVMANADFGSEDAVRLAGLAFSKDPQLAWRSAAMLADLLAAHGPQHAGLSLLFGKIAARTLQRLWFDLMQARYGTVHPFREPYAAVAMLRLRDRLAEVGRFGEALHHADLLDGHDANLPRYRVDAPEAFVDASCPLRPAERAALERLHRLIVEEGVEPAEVESLLAEVDVDLQRVLPSPMQLDETEVPQEEGVALLSVVETADAVEVTLGGAFGLHHASLEIAPAELNSLVFDALRALSSSAPPDVPPACRALHDIILAPLRAILDGHGTRVLVVRASGALRRIPFAVLHDGDGFLIERFAVVAHPGVAVSRPRAGLRRPIRAASLVVSDAPDLKPLPATREDAALLVRLVEQAGLGQVELVADGPDPARQLESAWSRRPTLLHLSSHFEADAFDAGRSAFVLADGSRYPLSRLALQDFSDVDLALMMGCGTQSMGDAADSMGITAIDALLSRMGVGAVLSTAWSVDDSAAHGFLRHFLEAALVARLDLAEAARSALRAQGRNAVTGRWAHPHAWGAFMLSGAWAGLE